jgi:hypothetical protein
MGTKTPGHGPEELPESHMWNITAAVMWKKAILLKGQQLVMKPGYTSAWKARDHR